ncbi:MAG: hypothetical protein IPH33_18430 [Bacteroidetes bacterium]|nr:hypothetical protein [Bacteroidota bacterium]
MAKDKRQIEVLLIDDEDNFRSSFILDAKSHRILIKGYNNLESALECLEENKKIKFVILDAKCFVNENQKTGEEDVEFLMYAPRAIEKIQQQQNRLIPMCIYTGYSEYSRISIKDLVLKYLEKGLQPDKLFHFI